MKPFGTPFGISFMFWSFIGLLRYLSERFNFPRRIETGELLTTKDIAVLLPAHNEELVIESSIAALRLNLPADQIYVASDGSHDRTAELARKIGVNVAELTPGRGKAKALKYLMKRYKLLSRYKLVFIVDADTKIDKDFIKNALPIFRDPEIVAVFGVPLIHWPKHIIPRDRMHIISYRERLDRILQWCYVYGQTWKYINVCYVIPGFATIYRSRVMRKIELDTPGLLIEDFHTAFQVQRQHLGKATTAPNIIGWDQHPDNLSDYWKQVKRWNIGFFQTVRRDGVWPSAFWLFLALFSTEVFLNSFFILVIPFLLLYLYLTNNPGTLPWLFPYVSLYGAIGPFQSLTIWEVVLSIFIIDYIMTIIIAVTHRKPQMLFYGLFFFFMHYVTSLILVSSILPGFFGSFNGRWVSPTRRKE